MKVTFYTKKAVYDHLCHILTDYENPEDTEIPVTEEFLYETLVDIVENWNDITGDDKAFQIKMHA